MANNSPNDSNQSDRTKCASQIGNWILLAAAILSVLSISEVRCKLGFENACPSESLPTSGTPK
jgi:hypothetical protein